MNIDPNLLEMMRCPACHAGNFTHVHRSNSSESLLCNSCKKEFYIKDGIIYLCILDEGNNIWDDVYDANIIKGNFQKGVKDIYNNLNFKDDEKE